jgi:hypothetical protein
MNSVIIANIIRFVALSLVQGLILQNIGAGLEDFPYVNILIYPLFIILLPLRTPQVLVIFLGFLIGISIDSFYLTPGVHSSAAIFTAFVRSFILKIMEPRAGYNVNYSPTAFRMGRGWFNQYAAALLLIHLFFYFSVEAFSFVFIGDILLKTLVGFALSMLAVIFYQVLFNPQE